MTMYTIQQVAEMAGVTHHNVYYLRKTGRVPSPVWVEGRLLFTQDNADAIIDYFKNKDNRWVRKPKKENN